MKLIYAIPQFDETGPMRGPYQLLKGFMRAGWDTEILTLSPAVSIEDDLAWGCVPVRRIATGGRLHPQVQMAGQLISHGSGTVVLSWVWYWYCYSLLAAKLLGRAPYVIVLDGYAHRHPWHGSSWRTQTRLALRYGPILRKANLIIAENPTASQQIQTHYPNQPLAQVPTCLWREDLEGIERTWDRDGHAPKRQPIILFTGRLARRKGVHDLLWAFSEVAHKFPDWTVEIRGIVEDTDYQNELRQIASVAGIESRIDFGPPLSGEALYRRFRTCSIYCLPSTGEGTPTSILEAMYYGGAIVASASGSVPYQLDNGRAGLIFKYGDTAQLRRHLELLISREDTRQQLMLAARQRILAQFVWEKHFDALESQFRVLASNPR